jgi:sulfite oxidase
MFHQRVLNDAFRACPAGVAAFLLGSGAVTTSADGDERIYSLSEVAKRDGSQGSGGRVWVSYGDGVFDITKFIESHPGGSAKISLAAGKALEPFWRLFPFHFEQSQVKDLLKDMRVGSLDPADIEATARTAAKSSQDDPFWNDPARHPALKIHGEKPCNAEVPDSLLTETYVTPADLFYIRHHHPVPFLKDPERDYKLVVDGSVAGGFKLELDLRQLRLLPQHEVTSTLQCSGNRRGDMNKVKKTSGTSWGQGAISTATWSGPRLADLLHLAGVSSLDTAEDLGATHACFTALDDMAASVPADKVLRRNADAIIALEMNGEPLPREHGFPARVIVPGVVAVRNVKWVKEVALAKEEAFGDWQRGLNYKVLPPNLSSAQGVDLSKFPAVMEASVFSGITAIEQSGEGSEDSDSKLTVDAKGWAWAGGGRGIARVDVSADGGKTWHEAAVTDGGEQPIGREWAWVFWEAPDVEATATDGAVEVVSRAVDKSYNSQPENAAHLWNIRGLCNNSWYRRSLKVD